MEQWPRDGISANPHACLISAGHFKPSPWCAVVPASQALSTSSRTSSPGIFDPSQLDERHLQDNRLQFIFSCCHLSVPAEARTVLTLHEVCDLTTEEMARVFITSAPAIARRIVCAKAKIRDVRIPYVVPSPTNSSPWFQICLSGPTP